MMCFTMSPLVFMTVLLIRHEGHYFTGEETEVQKR